MKIQHVCLIALAVVTISSVVTGCAPQRPVDVGPQVANPGAVYSPPTQPPPANQTDVVPACPGLLPQWWYLPGYWDWRGQWVWVPGHWRRRPHSGDIWLPGQWQAQNTSTGTIYVWHGGHWRSGAPADEESHDQ